MKKQQPTTYPLLWLMLGILLPLQLGCGRKNSKTKAADSQKLPKCKTDKSSRDADEGGGLIVPDAFKVLLTADGKRIDPAKVDHEVTVEIDGKAQTMPALAAAALLGEGRLLDELLKNSADVKKADDALEKQGGLMHRLMDNPAKIPTSKLTTILEKLTPDKAVAVEKTIDTKDYQNASLLHRVAEQPSETEAIELVTALLKSDALCGLINALATEKTSNKDWCTFEAVGQKYPEAAKLIIKKMNKKQAQSVNSWAVGAWANSPNVKALQEAVQARYKETHPGS